ncbi:uncharacterized protein LOC130667932 [Microplitis mediator]|uniref:uncharacterized protein LOC130667932 n=1 Tax=Microplitis mediator TaxID=375433 RepID=UPI002554D2CD|nr:uncharacterized protein LOC130667932 [Microplitis mediator]
MHVRFSSLSVVSLPDVLSGFPALVHEIVGLSGEYFPAAAELGQHYLSSPWRRHFGAKVYIYVVKEIRVMLAKVQAKVNINNLMIVIFTDIFYFCGDPSRVKSWRELIAHVQNSCGFKFLSFQIYHFGATFQ